MSEVELKEAVGAREAPEGLPLVVEIIPGQAAEGLIDIHEAGSYEGKTLRKLCDKMLSRKEWTLEERLIIEDINRQLRGGKMLCRGQEIEGYALDYSVPEETEAGERYFYVPVRVIKPQEGGCRQRSEGD
ncbi:MAG: hypothetical protein MUF52_01035 [Syntrophobacteraceae bacterium]|jgi:hypothetical protein|nr:hypothetical protein [Syntrophobacteraceae bacterium]